MASENHPIYMVGGSKGGVGKSFVTLALVDYLRRADVHVVLVETDTSNPDVMKAVHDEVECASCDLDEAGGWIDFVNFCDAHRDATRIVMRRSSSTQRHAARQGLRNMAERSPIRWASWRDVSLCCGSSIGSVTVSNC
jgi:CobQ/CobB/MinD/ParA nucleotide binding domain